MEKHKAKALATLLGGDAWHSGGGIFVVLLTNGQGEIIGITDECICLYADDDCLDRSTPLQTIELV